MRELLYILTRAVNGLSLGEAFVLLAAVLVLLAAALVWSFFRIRAVSLARRLGRGEEYWERKRALDRETPFRFVPRIFWFTCGALAVSIAVMIVLFLAGAVMSFITLFGIMYMEAGGDSSFYEGLMHLVRIWPGVLRVLVYLLLVSGALSMIRASYLQYKAAKALRAAAPEEESYEWEP